MREAIEIRIYEVDIMFEDLDKFIAENSEEILVTAGRTDVVLCQEKVQIKCNQFSLF